MSKEQDIRMAAFDYGYKSGREDALGEVEAKTRHMLEEAWRKGYEKAKAEQIWKDAIVNNPAMHRSRK